MAERRVQVAIEVGLHARPAAMFVQMASKSSGPVTLAKGDGEAVNAKSILSVLGLDVRHNDPIVLTAQEDHLLDELVQLVTSD